jgi:hypothetical protein
MVDFQCQSCHETVVCSSITDRCLCGGVVRSNAMCVLSPKGGSPSSYYGRVRKKIQLSIMEGFTTLVVKSNSNVDMEAVRFFNHLKSGNTYLKLVVVCTKDDLLGFDDFDERVCTNTEMARDDTVLNICTRIIALWDGKWDTGIGEFMLKTRPHPGVHDLVILD